MVVSSLVMLLHLQFLKSAPNKLLPLISNPFTIELDKLEHLRSNLGPNICPFITLYPVRKNFVGSIFFDFTFNKLIGNIGVLFDSFPSKSALSKYTLGPTITPLNKT